MWLLMGCGDRVVSSHAPPNANTRVPPYVTRVGCYAGGNVVFLLLFGSGGGCRQRWGGLRECLGLRQGAGGGARVAEGAVRRARSHAAPGSAGVSESPHPRLQIFGVRSTGGRDEIPVLLGSPWTLLSLL